MVRAGSTRCIPTSDMNSQLKLGSMVSLNACRMGNQPSVTPKRYSAPMASQKYGKEPMKIRMGGSAESMAPPRRHAARMPSRLPTTAAITSAVPPSRRVHPTCEAITSVTGVGKREMETPIWPVTMLCR
ncbi:hypothetical protein D9M72_361670 [compost metagenome]